MPTRIEYLDETWNIVTGCTKVSRGCAKCWAERMAVRLAANSGIAHHKRYEGFKPAFWPERLDIPERWRKPRVIGVAFGGDLFHEEIRDEAVADIWGRMREIPRHTFVVLTKRPGRAAAFLGRCGDDEGYGWVTHDATPPGKGYEGIGIIVGNADNWPLPNVWLGVSVEDAANMGRVDALRQIPAAVRFISFEPLLSAIPDVNLDGIQWVVCGAETGPGARLMKLDWARSLKDRCHAAGIRFFFKSAGTGVPIPEDLQIRGLP